MLRRALARLLVAGGPLATAACPCPEPDFIPHPASVEVVPHNVAVQTSTIANDTTTFEVEALVRDEDGRVIAKERGPEPAWTLSTGGAHVSIDDLDARRAVVKVTMNGLPGTLEDTARATVNSSIRSRPSSAMSINPNNLGPDRIIAQHLPGASPSVTILDGKFRGGSCLDTVVAFVREASLGDLLSDCDAGRHLVTLFAADWAMESRVTGWTGGDDSVRTDEDQVPPLVLPIALWISVSEGLGDGLTRAGTLALAQADVRQTNAVWRTNRVGIVVTVDTSAILDSPVDPTACSPRKSAVLNVYYINKIAGASGFMCSRTGARLEDVIFIGAAGHAPVTLAHEFGHVLGLLAPAGGHSNEIKGFQSYNVMMSGMNDQAFAARSHLSLGQVFRMNADTASWMQRGGLRPGRLTLGCQCHPFARRPCPRLIEAIVPLEGGDEREYKSWWNCGGEEAARDENGW